VQERSGAGSYAIPVERIIAHSRGDSLRLGRACARCGFYRPKNSAAALFPEGKKNLLRLQQDIPLTEAEANAVVDGVNAFEKLLAQLSDVPTPEGPTPRQLQSGLVQIQPTKEGSK